MFPALMFAADPVKDVLHRLAPLAECGIRLPCRFSLLIRSLQLCALVSPAKLVDGVCGCVCGLRHMPLR